jgi:hypothetical protein
MAKKKTVYLREDKQRNIQMYRDSKGRIRNAYQISPENQEKLYQNKSLNVKPVFTEIVRTKKTKKVKGKTKIFFDRKVIYVDEKGNRKTEKDFTQFNYLRNLNEDNRQITTTREAISFNIFATLKNAIIESKNVTFNGIKYTPKQLIDFIKKLRESFIKDGKVVAYPTYEIQEQENGNLIINETGGGEE